MQSFRCGDRAIASWPITKPSSRTYTIARRTEGEPHASRLRPSSGDGLPRAAGRRPTTASRAAGPRRRRGTGRRWRSYDPDPRRGRARRGGRPIPPLPWRSQAMNSIVYIVGAVVIVIAILSFLGLR